jgi:hypothetical protein
MQKSTPLTKGGRVVNDYDDRHDQFATGGPVHNAKLDKHFKQQRDEYGRFLSTTDRFTGGRKPAGFPEETETGENWSK